MKHDDTQVRARRRFLTAMGLTATGAAMAAPARAASQEQQPHAGFVPARHPEDSWMNEMAGSHRAFVDSSTGPGGVAAMNFASNILSAHASAYAGASESDYALIVCFRHDSSPFGFNNAMWAKYGELFSTRTGYRDQESGAALEINPLSISGTYGNRGNTVSALADLGITFAICNLSTRGMAGMLARARGESSEEIYQELISNSIPNGRFVPAGVVAATRAQEYGYSFLYSA